MKKQILTIAAVLGVSAAIAQDAPTSKNGYVVLPEAGDIAIQMDAVPMLNFALNAVNIMNNTGQQAQHPGFVSGFGQTLVGKYFLTETMAVRGKLAINTGKMTDKIYGDNPLTPLTNMNALEPENVLIQTSSMSQRMVVLGGGVELRRGHNRLQGFYGGEVLIGFMSESEKHKYAHEWNDANKDSLGLAPGATRLLSDKSGTGIMLAARGFAGVEYFVLPKISIGAEFGWTLGTMMQGRGSTTTEHWNIKPGKTDPEQYTITTKGNSQGMSGTQVEDGSSTMLGGSAALTVTFHF